MINKIGQTVLIVCDSPKSLLDFRGKLIEEIAKKHQVIVYTPTIKQDYVRDKLESLNITIFENELQGSKVSMYGDLRFIVSLYRLLKK